MRKRSSSSSADGIIAGTITAGTDRDFTGAVMRGVAGLDGAVVGAGTAGVAAAIPTDMSVSVAVTGGYTLLLVGSPNAINTMSRSPYAAWEKWSLPIRPTQALTQARSI